MPKRGRKTNWNFRARPEKVRPDQALAPERQVVRDCLVAPLREEAMGLGIGAGQIAWG